MSSEPPVQPHFAPPARTEWPPFSAEMPPMSVNLPAELDVPAQPNSGVTSFRHPARRFRRLGRTALVVAIGAIVVESAGIVVGGNGQLIVATVFAWVAIVLSAAAALGGLVAVIQRKRRRLGVYAVIVGVLGNPLVLVWLLRVLG